MTVACLITYLLMTRGLARLVGGDPLLGGLWALISTIFVFRDTDRDALSAGLMRVLATCASCALCLPYLWFFPSSPLSFAGLLAAGTVIVILLGRRDEVVVVAITTAVVMLVAQIDPGHAWQQPLLRLFDTVVGVAIGVSCAWIGSHIYSRLAGERPQSVSTGTGR